eukprot:Hpha_TRINITY_DN28494_c0_g1::TRINITY_DN28494_c0_g1_i1::g.183957::m.183957
MPLVRIAHTLQKSPVAMRPLYQRLCTLFNVTEESRVLRVVVQKAEEMYPEQILFDIRAKVKPERTPEHVKSIARGIEKFVQESDSTLPPARVRIELYDPKLGHGGDN